MALGRCSETLHDDPNDRWSSVVETKIGTWSASTQTGSLDHLVVR
jgi:hypothetical protein